MMPKCVKIVREYPLGGDDKSTYQFCVYATDTGAVELMFENDHMSLAVILPWRALAELVDGLNEAAKVCGYCKL